MKKKIFFFRESVVCPYVNYKHKKRKLFISNIDIFDIIDYVESTGLVAI